MPETTDTYETPAPRYTEADDNVFSARLKAFQNNYPYYPIVPVTRHPSDPESSQSQRYTYSRSTKPWKSARDEAHALQADIITALFGNISSKDTTTVTLLITQGLISPDCPKPNGETPLLASIRIHSAPTARVLLNLSADPNLVGNAEPDQGSVCVVERRTPLMLAAATGQLVIVRMLMDDFGADDAVVGPKGETALRLAAEAGHRDVVRYLPARRSGAWRRLRCSKEVFALRKAAKSVGKVVMFLGWDLPRLLLVDIPWEGLRWVWKRRHRVGPWVVKVVRKVPGGLRAMAKGIWSSVKGMPRFVWRLIVWTSEAVPRACGILWEGVVEGVKRVAHAFAFAAMRMVSVLHSFFAAIITRLKNTKLRDVGHDLLVAMEAVFVKLPRAVWAFMSQSVAVAGRTVKACFSSYWIRALFKLLCIIPQTFWSMLESLWTSFGRGLDELITLVNPKRVPSGASRS